jgi:hypothetical protein
MWKKPPTRLPACKADATVAVFVAEAGIEKALAQ